jgi:hypothetical protein
MDFRTPISKIQPLPRWFPGDPVVAIGSCFAQHMGLRLRASGSPAHINPFGTLFSPTALERVMKEDVAWILEDNHYTKREDIYYSWHHHSDLFDYNLINLQANLQHRHQEWHQQMSKAKWCLITLGTAWVYVLKEHNQIVANCHKQPGGWFDKILLSIDHIIESLHGIVQSILEFNPTIHIVWTVSPVRHLKDGFVENQRGKAHLIAALHEFLARGQHGYYFPAYEIMMDDLRDYRFYGEDMVHPSTQAVDYIWQQWIKSVCDEDVLLWLSDLDKLKRGQAHRTLRPESVPHQSFLNQLKQQMNSLKTRFPDAELN